ncbi:oxidoreductase [Sphingomonas parva]|uniref:Oxidoreductase n=2 Tax=Sphingomonas parva TaxID=2555898 RepID=A0A4Y8ZSQ6_9SPHN|nr:oxidoreductase [Sphingomonas parva]
MELVAEAGSADAADLIARGDIDLLVVAAPNHAHFALAEAALSAGKHVVVDKPFTVTTAEADVLLALAAARQRMLTVFQNRRWDGDFLTVRAMIESGRLGEILLFEAHWDRFRPAIKPGWRERPSEGGGLFVDLGAHLVDQALVLFGRPEALSADLVRQRQQAEVDDYFDLILHYGRMRARLSASTLVTAPRPRFALYGTEGALVKHGLDPQEARLRDGGDVLDPGFGIEDEADYALFTPADGPAERIATVPGCYRTFYEEVAEALLRGGPPPVDPRSARNGLLVLELARESAREGKRLTL